MVGHSPQVFTPEDPNPCPGNVWCRYQKSLNFDEIVATVLCSSSTIFLHENWVSPADVCRVVVTHFPHRRSPGDIWESQRVYGVPLEGYTQSPTP